MNAHVRLRGRPFEPPLQIPVDQLVLYDDGGTAIAFAETLPDGRSLLFSVLGADDFNRRLREAGLPSTQVARLHMQG